MVKLIAIDLDDTLLDNSRRISPRVKAAVREAKARGVAVTLATGRMHRSALPYALELELDIPLITYNGALIKFSRSGETLFHCPLDAAVAGGVLGLFRRKSWYVQVYADDLLYVRERDANARRYEEVSGMEAVVVGDGLYDLGDRPPTKMLAIAEPADMDGLVGAVRELYGDRLYLATSKPNYLEILNPGANKGLALARLADYFGLDRREVMAIGDSLNDKEMLEYAGLGVAMHNAAAAVKSVADAVTGANDADGVAEAVEKYVLGGLA